MRSRVARVGLQLTGMVPVALVVVLTTGAATAQAAPRQVTAQDDPLEFLSSPVGVIAIALGVAGMIAGVFRRKKIEIQPENQRKS